MRKMGVVLMVAVMGLAGGCGREEGAGTAAGGAVAGGAVPATVEWVVAVPNTPWQVKVRRPADWKTHEAAGGQPVLYKTGKGEELLAEWRFAVRTGMDGRTVEEILEQVAGSIGRKKGVEVVEKKVEVRGGKPVGIVLSRQMAGELKVTVREYFYALDGDTVMSITETVPSGRWEEEAVGMNRITESVEVEGR